MKATIKIGDLEIECVPWTIELTGKVTYEIQTEDSIFAFDTEEEAIELGRVMDKPFRFAKVEEIKL